MALDSICLTAVLVEVKKAILGGKIDKIYQPSRDELVLAIRGAGANVKLLLSANPGAPRIQLTETVRENPETPPMFCMLLRKHLLAARILEITQPPMERSVTLVLETKNELGDKIERRLVLEAMGRNANLILLDSENRITDCTRRVEGDLLTGKRQVMPGLFYHPPEPHPGVPPLLAREFEFRGVLDIPGELLALQAAAEAGECTPTMLLRDGKPADFSVLPILQYGLDSENRSYETFGALLDDFYANREVHEGGSSRGTELNKSVTSARNRIARKLENQRRELDSSKNRDRQRELGDLVTSNLHNLQKGMTHYKTLDFYDENGGEVDIQLDPLLTPQQNAAKYYKNYTKAKTAEGVLTEQIAKGEDELSYLDSVLENLTLAEGERDVLETRRELEDTGYLRRKKAAGKKVMKSALKPMEFRSSAGLRISVGKNNAQNDELTTKKAFKSDLWFHTQKIHGSHVILWTEGETPDLLSVTEAAQLAAWFSQGREGGKVAVDYTPVKYVKKPAGARPGMVVYTTYETALVTPNEELVRKLRVK
ncbi:MAG: NFACT RNA binding domain-containing protein [Oscillospiraceae bacterium]